MDLVASAEKNHRRRTQHFSFDLQSGQCGHTSETEDESSTTKWWRNTIIYQIYPRSFQDSNGDGVGDLPGIRSRLPYLKELGIESVWISPFYKSPMEDFGYDISDFCDVDPMFGSLADFDQLSDSAHSLGIHVVVDFVPNHTSDRHPWFVASQQSRDNPYADYYVWHNGDASSTVMNNGKSIPAPPTKWVSVFGGSAWKWNDQRCQYYLHQFLPSQPDLNFRCPAVVQEMDNVLLFWLKRGVDGFRMDAVKHLFEVELPEQLNSAGFDKCSQMHNQPETLEMVKHWRRLLDEYSRDTLTAYKLLITEVTGEITDCIPYYLNGADYSFNFSLLNLRAGLNGFDVDFHVTNFLLLCGDQVWPNWVVGNHDVQRIVDRFRTERIVDGINMLNLLLPGTANVYYGEELGMCGARVEFYQDVQDTFAKRDPIFWKLKNRDPARSPMQWNGDVGGGFTTDTPWLPSADNFRSCSVQVQQSDPRSHLSVFKKLVDLRKLPAFTHGRFKTAAVSEFLYSFYRQYQSEEYIVIIDVRLPEQTGTFDRQNHYDLSGGSGDAMAEVVVSSRHCAYQWGDKVLLKDIILQPTDSLVVKVFGKMVR